MFNESVEDADKVLADLIGRCALGDRAAFRSLYEATASILLGVIARLVGRGAQAEDLLQDVYVRIWQSATQYRAGSGTPMAWMAAAARYRAIDHLRARSSRPESTVSDLQHGTGEDDDENDPTQRTADPGPAPDEKVEAQIRAVAVRDCLAKLNGPQQQSIALAYYRGLSHDEIASHLHAPLGSVKSWVRRGMGALKECLERCGWSGAPS